MSNFRDAFIDLTRASGEKVKEFPGVTCTRFPFHDADFNQAIIQDERGLRPSTLREVQQFFREIKTEWLFVVPPPTSGLFGETIRHIKISQRRSIPQMVLGRKEGVDSMPIPPAPAGLEIRPARTVSEMRMWAKTTMAGFGRGRRDTFRSILNAQSLRRYGFVSYLGWVRGKAVATSGCFISDGVAGIFAVSTIPTARGRGYGEAMTWAAIRDARSKRCDLFSLQASPMGFPVYYRMGFRRIYDVEEWVVPAKAPDVTG
jgi:GNAT superfamily N-acetyltransferase